MTDIQRNVSIVEEQAQAIRKTAQTMHQLIDSISADGGYAGIRAALEAKCEGVEMWAQQIWGEAALIRGADEYQQERLAAALAAAEPTAVDVLGDADGVAGVESEDEYSVCGHCGKTLYDGPAGSDWDGRPVCDDCLRQFTPDEDPDDDDAAEWFNLAQARVESSITLRVHRDFILADWPEGVGHLRWVATAPHDEILKWAEDGEGAEMDAALDPREGEIN